MVRWIIILLLSVIEAMNASDAYFFIIFPKFIQTKGFVLDRKLPQFSISAFIGTSSTMQIVSR